MKDVRSFSLQVLLCEQTKYFSAFASCSYAHSVTSNIDVFGTKVLSLFGQCVQFFQKGILVCLIKYSFLWYVRAHMDLLISKDQSKRWWSPVAWLVELTIQCELKEQNMSLLLTTDSLWDRFNIFSMKFCFLFMF